MDPFFPENLRGIVYLMRSARCAAVPKIVCSSVKSTWISAALRPEVRNPIAANRATDPFPPLFFGFLLGANEMDGADSEHERHEEISIETESMLNKVGLPVMIVDSQGPTSLGGLRSVLVGSRGSGGPRDYPRGYLGGSSRSWWSTLVLVDQKTVLVDSARCGMSKAALVCRRRWSSQETDVTSTRKTSRSGQTCSSHSRRRSIRCRANDAEREERGWSLASLPTGCTTR